MGKISPKESVKIPFKNKKSGACGVCNKDYPIKLLATGTHKKKNLDCSDMEKRDFNVVMPACHLKVVTSCMN